MDEKCKEPNSKMTINEGASTSNGNAQPELINTKLSSSSNSNFTTDEDNMIPDDAVCVFCKRRTNNKLQLLYKNHETVNALSLLSIEYEELPSLRDYICFQCVYRINLIVDYRRLLERNFKKSRANYYYSIGDKEKCRQYLLSSTNSTCNGRTQDYKNFPLRGTKSENNVTCSSTSNILLFNNLNNSYNGANTNNNNLLPRFPISSVRSINTPIRPSKVPILTNFADEYDVITAAQQDYLFDLFLRSGEKDYLSKFDSSITTPTNTTGNTTSVTSGNVIPLASSSTMTSIATATATTQTQTIEETIPAASSSNPALLTTPDEPSLSGESLYKVLYEDSPQSVLVTESGGASDRILLKTPYKCEICSKYFTRSRLLRKHQRQHLNNNNNGNSRKRRKQSTIASSYRSSQRTTQYKCKECDQIFPNVSLLKQHQKDLHLSSYKCSYCNVEMYNRADFELHEPICIGKKLATEQNLNNEFHHGYRTRSKRNMALTKIQNRRNTNDGAGPSGYNNHNIRRNHNYYSGGETIYDDDSDDDIEMNETLYNEKVRNISAWVQNQSNDYRNGDNDSDSIIEIASSINTSFTRESSLSRASSLSRTGTETECTDISSVSTRRKNKSEISENSFIISSSGLKRAKDSVRGRPKRKRKSICYVNNSEEDEQGYQNQKGIIIDEPAEFGYPARLITTPHLDASEIKTFICPQYDCTYTDTCLNRLMVHDIKNHGQLPLFYCKICKKRFIRRFYLYQHLMYQCYNWYFCIKCEKKFHYQFELDEHLILHKTTLSHDCNICSLSFLTVNELRNHLSSKKHSKKVSQKRLTIIERRVYDVKDKTLTSNANYDKQQQEQGQQLSSQSQENSNENPTDKTSNNVSQPLSSSYRSEIRILKLMDTEREEKREKLKWRYGTVFELLQGNVQNCGVTKKIISYPK